MPTPAPRPSLVVLEAGDQADKGKVYPLDGKTVYTLGRGHQADIPVMDIKCSREHCRIERRADGYYLVDLGSTNGTKVNGKRLKKKSERPLAPGDQVQLGLWTLSFEGPRPAAAVQAPAPATARVAAPAAKGPAPFDFDFGDLAPSAPATPPPAPKQPASP
ncbi:MAG: FHA domain-containing protein, partial [Planctomycetota bacterium]|nr:FHA domain-containing protein [Planctomycetota bacterium]